MFEMVVGEGGIGCCVCVDGYWIGGKIGIVCKQVGVSYVKGKYCVLFVGMVLMSNLCLIVVVMIDELCGKGYYGGIVVGLVFVLVMSGLLQLFGVLFDVLVEVEKNVLVKVVVLQKMVVVLKVVVVMMIVMQKLLVLFRIIV